MQCSAKKLSKCWQCCSKLLKLISWRTIVDISVFIHKDVNGKWWYLNSWRFSRNFRIPIKNSRKSSKLLYQINSKLTGLHISFEEWQEELWRISSVETITCVNDWKYREENTSGGTCITARLDIVVIIPGWPTACHSHCVRYSIGRS